MKRSRIYMAAVILYGGVIMAAEAAFVSTANDLSGTFDIFDFEDANPNVFSANMTDLSGSADFNIPPTGNYDWFLDGTIFIDIIPEVPGGEFNLPFANQLIFSGPFDASSFIQRQHSFDFDNNVFTSTAGIFAVPYGGLNDLVNALAGQIVLPPGGGAGLLQFDYTIDANSDVALSLTDMNTVPAGFEQSLSVLDNLGNDDGRINGIFTMNTTLTAVQTVPEPGTMALLFLGMMALIWRKALPMRRSMG